MTDLEKQFLESAKIAKEAISEKLSAANQEIKAAQDISEQYGIPFIWDSPDPDISNLKYIPESMFRKWKDLDKKFISNEIDFIYYDVPGWAEFWQSSSYGC